MSPMADDKPAYQPEWVTKVDVARRQIVAAIRMFYERTDPIVAHSVISAGHQILTDVGAKSRIDGLLRGGKQSREGRAKWNIAANFFKHADNDAHGRLNEVSLGLPKTRALARSPLMHHTLQRDQRLVVGAPQTYSCIPTTPYRDAASKEETRGCSQCDQALLACIRCGAWSPALRSSIEPRVPPIGRCLSLGVAGHSTLSKPHADTTASEATQALCSFAVL